MSKPRLIVFASLVAVLIAVVVFAVTTMSAKRRAESRGCASGVTSISLAVRLWAEDNNGVCATNFISMSNELATLRILVCPGDHQRQKATDWPSFTPVHSSYEIISPGLRVEDTNTPFLRCVVHNYLGYTDGTVFDGVRRRHKYD
jgi:hypothetical protein